MPYFNYIDGDLQYNRKNYSLGSNTIYRTTDTELDLTYRIAFYPAMGAYLAYVIIDSAVYAGVDCCWELPE